MNAHASVPVTPDRTALDTFVDAIFRHADDDSYVSLRVFNDDKKGSEAFYIDTPILSDPTLLDRVAWTANHANKQSRPAVFAPPVATFSNPRKAAQADLANGLAISVECDAAPVGALATLTTVLGKPTLVCASGGEWANPETGEVEAKLHLHWRLTEPTREQADHARLKKARELAAKIVGADATSIPINHPMRWPGSVHRKREPRLATIVAQTENEVELSAALESLQWTFDEIEALKAEQKEKPSQGQAGAGTDLPPDYAGDLLDVAAALAAIPNTDLTWERWNRIGMATWKASEGRAFPAFDAWSRKSSKYDSAATAERWKHFTKFPPEKIGAGTLYWEAKQACPGWRKPSSRARRNRTSDDADAAGSNEQLVTEDEAALRFAERYAGKLRFCHDHGVWFEWTGSTWKQNGTGLAFHWARELARQMVAEEDDKTKVTGSKAAFAGSVERFARSDPALAVTADRWDRDPFLLGTPAGTVDLRTGLLRSADPADGITKTAAVAPADVAVCPLWLRFLDETTGGEAEMVRFLQQWCGYSLTGDTREHALCFVFGGGGNGKSVYLNVTSGVIGDYATTAAMETFIASGGDKHPTDLAMLRGARLVTASETEEGRQWAESRIKQLTGGDKISARFMRQDYFTFLPAFKLTIIGNHKPLLRNIDDAARRRFNLVPFILKPEKPDRLLEEKLKTEWPGILRWMIDGCLDWQANGLVRPSSVIEATKSYFDAQDTFGAWLDEDCDCDQGNQYKSETSAELFGAWQRYAKNAGEIAGTKKSFADQLQRRGFEARKGGKGVRTYSGIRLRPSARSTVFDDVAA